MRQFHTRSIALAGGDGNRAAAGLSDRAQRPDLSYLEIVRTPDKVLGGVANPAQELGVLAWLTGITVAFALMTLALFVARDPPK